MNDDDTQLTLGIVGLGTHGTAYADIATDLGHGVSGVDADPRTRREFQKQFETTTFESLDNLFETDEERLEELLDVDSLTRYTENTITDADALTAELERTETQDIAFDDEEYDEGIRCVASAISDTSGELLGAISVSGPTERIDEDRFRSEIPHQIRNAVGVVEINSTYSQWSEQFSP